MAWRQERAIGGWMYAECPQAEWTSSHPLYAAPPSAPALSQGEREAVERVKKAVGSRMAGCRSDARHRRGDYEAELACQIKTATVAGLSLSDLRTLLSILQPEGGANG